MKRRDLFLKNKLDRSMDFVLINILAQISESPHEKNNIVVMCYEKIMNLCSVFAVLIKEAWILSYPLSAQQRL